MLLNTHSVQPVEIGQPYSSDANGLDRPEKFKSNILIILHNIVSGSGSGMNQKRNCLAWKNNEKSIENVASSTCHIITKIKTI